MGKQRLEKYQARRKAQLDLDARLGRNKFGLSRSAAPRSNMKGSVQRSNVIGFVVNSKGTPVIASRLYRDPKYDEIEQVSDLLMPSESVPSIVAEARRELRRITPEFGRGAPSLFDACVLVDEGRHALHRFTPQPALVHERSNHFEGRSRHVYSSGSCLPMYQVGRVKYHWPTCDALPSIQHVDVRAQERDRLADDLSLFYLARTEAAQQVSEVWPWPVDWTEGAPSIE